ncbi:MAG: type IV toxin-antitoxin system AbiEi family antitoxin domain-containing protein [Gordonia sp. (in: high G+C Gram-positive bacteria)]|uniref:type IV toxin-antitoxin system AbiEi family antitoxin domain-containing protein n=1 Tax=Gordonia sp. (in: high G+C Gram-positive bacteria) TaxID=84139 RepID=UPI0039E6F89C
MDLDELIIRHDGVLTRAQALDSGMSPAAIQRRIDSGRWRRIARGVYLVATHARSERAQARLAVHSVGARAVLGGTAAAWWLGLWVDPPRKHLVYTAVSGRHPRRTSTTVVRERAIAVEDVAVHRGLRTTAPALTALDASIESGIAILDSMLLRRVVTLDALRAAHERYPKRHGVGVVSGYLVLLGSGARSEAERLAVRVFRRAGIQGWCANYPSCGYILDFAFPARRLAIEIDGLAFHRDARAFQHDRTRRNALIAAGWEVLNFTWADLVDRPDELVRRVRQVLANRAA